MRARRTMVSALVLAFLAAVSGCERDHPTLVSPRGGIISGAVSDGAPIDEEIVVRVESVGNPQMQISVVTTTDFDGRFAVSVPNGAYRVSFETESQWGYVYHGADGPVLSSAAADTVRVAGDEQELDFACGRVAFDIALPASLVGQTMWCRLVPVGDSNVSRERSGYVQDGLQMVVRFVPPGLYRVGLDAQGLTGVYLPPTFDPEAADAIEVAAGQERAYAAGIDALTTLSGSVTGSWQTFGINLPSVHVRAGNRGIEETEVDADGNFSFTFLAGGSFRLEVRIGSVTRWIGGTDEDSATTFELETGGGITGVDHVESGLECVLTGEVDLYGAFGELYDDQGQSLCWASSIGDTLHFSNLRPGPVYLRLTPRTLSSWLPQYFDRRDSLAVADPIIVPPDGQIAHVISTVVRGGRIRGRILDVTGLPPDRDRLEFVVHAADDSVNSFRSYYFFSANYDEVTGEYALNQIPDGAYKLRAREKEVWTWWPHAPSFAAAGTVTVEDHADVVVDDWQLLH